MSSQAASVIGLDLGTSRIGVAWAVWPDGIAQPLTVLDNDANFLDNLNNLIMKENIVLVVAGLPRNLSGGNTHQTKYAVDLGNKIKKSTGLPLFFQDEAATSIKAEAELKLRNKPYTKKDIDSLSATYVLEDFINSHPKGAGVEV
jgi:putative Holliday junction resolvase